MLVLIAPPAAPPAPPPKVSKVPPFLIVLPTEPDLQPQPRRPTVH